MNGIPSIPDCELLRCIGRGSYGEVWLARNILGESRAVKVVHRATFEDDRPFEREFEGIRRFEPISRSHPSQLNILHVGRSEGCFYYVMELADAAPEPNEVGRDVPIAPRRRAEDSPPYQPHTLKHDLKTRGRLPPADCIEIGLALTTALAHLHGHGLVHRDIKPSNIIFVGGVPKLADIGLVTDVDASRSFVGTEGYLPPEGPGTPQADLYSLGKVLYEMSTGRDRKDYPALPLDWDSLDAAEQARLLELNEVLVKVCEADPRRRYQSAGQLRDDLGLLQRGASVREHRRSKRRGVLVKILGAASLAFALVVGVVTFRSNQDRKEEETRREAAAKVCQEARRNLNQQTKDGFTQAIGLFHQAIALDPACVPAYVGLADAHYSRSGWDRPPQESMPLARWAATKALELDENSVEARVWLARIKSSFEWNWAGADAEFKQAIRLQPANTVVHECYAIFLASLGRFDEARSEMTLAAARGDPSHRFYYSSGLVLYWTRDYDQALAQARRGLSAEINSALCHSLLLDCYRMKRMYTEALAEGERLRALDDSPHAVAELGQLNALSGRTNEARQFLAQLEQEAKTRHVSAFFRALVHLGLGEKDKALDCLEQAADERFGWLGNLKVEPTWDALRDEPRFRALLKRIGLEP